MRKWNGWIKCSLNMCNFNFPTVSSSGIKYLLYLLWSCTFLNFGSPTVLLHIRPMWTSSKTDPESEGDLGGRPLSWSLLHEAEANIRFLWMTFIFLWLDPIFACLLIFMCLVCRNIYYQWCFLSLKPHLKIWEKYKNILFSLDY